MGQEFLPLGFGDQLEFFSMEKQPHGQIVNGQNLNTPGMRIGGGGLARFANPR